MKTVRCTRELVGSTVNVPHTEHRVAGDEKTREKNAVTFDSSGKARVSDTMADALLEFYPNQVTVR